MMENPSGNAPLAKILMSMMPEGLEVSGDEADSPAVARRKKEILDASLRVFSAKGFDGGRTREIARESGASEATIFKYFPTKRHLMLALIKPLVETIGRPLFMKPIERLLERQKGRPLEETLTLIMIDRWKLFTEKESLVSLAYLEAFRNPEMLEAFKQLIVPQILGYLEPLFHEAAAAGEIRADLLPRLLSRSFLAQVLGFIVLVRLSPEDFALEDIEADIGATVSLFVEGLRPENGFRKERTHGQH